MNTTEISHSHWERVLETYEGTEKLTVHGITDGTRANISLDTVKEEEDGGGPKAPAASEGALKQSTLGGLPGGGMQ